MGVLAVVARSQVGLRIGVYIGVFANVNWWVQSARVKFGFSRTRVGITLAQSIAMCLAVVTNSLVVVVSMSSQIGHAFKVAIGTQ